MRTNYLLLGICGISSIFMSCNKMTNHDYRADSDWVYQNHSSHELYIVLGQGEYNDSEVNFVLPAGANHTVELRSFPQRIIYRQRILVRRISIMEQRLKSVRQNMR